MFSKRWLINYGLIVLIVIFSYVGNRFGVETGYQSKPRITELKPDVIDSIEIQTADASLTLKRGDRGWMLVSPIEWPANNINLNRLLNILNSETDSRIAAAEVDLATLGLQSPRAMLRLNDTQVLFGATNNIGARRYIKIDSTIYLLPDIHLAFISQGLIGIVDRRLLPGRYALAQLKLPDTTISRNDDKIWEMTTNNGITQSKIDSLIENWQGLEASRVKRFDAAAIPRQKIEARLESGSIEEFFVMSIEPEIVIAHPRIGLQYHFRAGHYYQLISLRNDEISN